MYLCRDPIQLSHSRAEVSLFSLIKLRPVIESSQTGHLYPGLVFETVTVVVSVRSEYC